MDKNATWKWLILAMMVAGSLALVTPPMDRRDEEGRIVQRGRIQYGLDLRGGSSFVVEVDQDALRQELRRRSPDISETDLDRRVGRELRTARESALEAIRNRVDGMGIAEPQIYTHMENRIVIQMPGIDAERQEAARETIQSVAFLEFRLVHEMSHRWIERLRADERAPRGYRWVPGQPYLVIDPAVPEEARDRAFHEETRRFAPREGAEFMLERDELDDGSRVYRPRYVETAVQLTGEAISTARVEYDQMGVPKISLELNSAGRRRFAQITRDYARGGARNPDRERGRQLAIIMDGRLYSAPELITEILGGQAEITGSFTVQDAQRIVNVLRTGALPVPVRIIEERTVAPSLGRDAIRSGVNAALLGGLAVLVFMLVYYGVAGIIANLALLLVFIMLPLGMVVVSGFMGVLTQTGAAATAGMLPTLTLPGIAGIVLTLGMAVDANVLIFERIREEQASGKRLLAAIPAGYAKAFSTIFDSNITTLLAALIMFWQGSGPVRGYAVTLSAGILISMFTAIVVTRLFFEFIAQRTGITRLRMMNWVRNPKIDFLGKRRLALATSAVLFALTWGLFIHRGEANFGVDFLGGSAFTVAHYGAVAERVPEGTLRDALAARGIVDASIQYQGVLGVTAEEAARDLLSVRVTFDQGAAAREVLDETLPAERYTVVQQDEVGPQIGRELQRRGIMALLWAMAGIILYISWRFEFSFAVAAIVALLHDALLAIGIFCLFGRQLSMPMIAAVLTIIGYSVNDTIVVFDRIREDLKLMRGRPYSEIANISINQTLSRTLLTSGTTLLVLVALFVFGGGAINDFALMLLIGVLVGTYSSIFVATPIVLLWHPDKAARAEA